VWTHILDAHALGPDYSEITILIFNVYAYTFMRRVIIFDFVVVKLELVSLLYFLMHVC